MRVTLDRPWLELDLGDEVRVLSWSLTRPGFVSAQRIVWREVRNADLPEDLDVLAWYRGELAARGAGDAVAMLTSRDLDAFETAEAQVEGVRAFCLATVGLSNAERVGTRMDRSGKDWGTINIALHLDLPLSDAALLELLSIAAQARTAAVMEAGHHLPTGLATGTGTDCIAVAAPPGDAPFAGLHTPQGEAAGRAVHDAVRKGAEFWMRHVRRPDDP
ncbi:adenosylcobinamide amidohydrolase [Antarcticimicrobium luteum]|uniref:Adenosylcobinamide amidohydrolase n=1 Tax=Antarcticimicrobium luteum TaxID=2547397 RepID=A0A4V3AQ33_9RHOB|nr:adenosylcobinamide amidohydrolase [Antarcticimicrobium luteum]TDK41217.1 adenosylcobinamide amidohydrolase [Antarcticimicrobium luteum]